MLRKLHKLLMMYISFTFTRQSFTMRFACAHKEWIPAKHEWLTRNNKINANTWTDKFVIILQTCALHKPIANTSLTFLHCTVIEVWAAPWFLLHYSVTSCWVIYTSKEFVHMRCLIAAHGKHGRQLKCH